jgi:ATP-dependent RNA circularization protein (DNA/RNA ligase family)
MPQTDKYGRTYHFPFSPGATKDDRVNHNWIEDCQSINQLVFTEKLDGENTCLSRNGVYARSHAAPTITPWTSWIRQQWAPKQFDLPENIELFGENLEGIHSIEYKNLSSLFYMFAVRDNDKDLWLSWNEVQWYAEYFGFPCVPVLGIFPPIEVEEKVLEISQSSSIFDSYNPITGEKCTMEGIVVRNIDEFSTSNFRNNVFKYVRSNHVITDEHWTKNWKRAKIKGTY